MPVNIMEEWNPHIQEIVSSPGVTVVLGATDVGKTTFCTLLANHALNAGISTAVVDGDMGQSEIGPPTTIGLGLVDSEIQVLSDLRLRSFYFVGSTTPVDNMLGTVTGAKKMVDKAQSLGAQLVIADTTGLIRGVIARNLKTAKIELLAPRHIVALQKADEAEHFLRFFDSWASCTVHRLRVSHAVKAKPPAIRSQRRVLRFREYFLNGHVQELPLEALTTSGTWLKTGRPLEIKYLKFAEKALNAQVLYGETIGRGIYLVVAGEYNKHGIDQLQEYFRTKGVMVVPIARYINLAVGLLDSHLELLSIGIVQGMDFRAGSVSVYTPLRSIAPVRSIVFGALKLRPDGTEIGRLHPGEL